MWRFGAAARAGGSGPVTCTFLRERLPVPGGLGAGGGGVVGG